MKEGAVLETMSYRKVCFQVAMIREEIGVVLSA